jgi:uncharacterized protein Usg
MASRLPDESHLVETTFWSNARNWPFPPLLMQFCEIWQNGRETNEKTSFD